MSSLLHVSPSCLRSRLRGVQRVRCLPLRCTLLVHQHAPMCPTVHRKLVGVGVCSPRLAGHQVRTRLRVASDWLPRRCTAGVTPASVRHRDRRTEARTSPGPLCSRNGRPHPTFPGATLRQQPFVLGRGGGGLGKSLLKGLGAQRHSRHVTAIKAPTLQTRSLARPHVWRECLRRLQQILGAPGRCLQQLRLLSQTLSLLRVDARATLHTELERGQER